MVAQGTISREFAMPDRTPLLLQILDQAFDRKAWHGTTLRGALRGLTPEVALWRPAPDRHNVWELLLHAAYWKYIVRRKLTRDASRSFPRSPSNFPAIPTTADAKALKADLALLGTEHRALRQIVASFPDRRLDDLADDSKWTHLEFIHGAAAHDLYHAGQIQLLKRMRSG